MRKLKVILKLFLSNRWFVVTTATGDMKWSQSGMDTNDFKSIAYTVQRKANEELQCHNAVLEVRRILDEQ